MNKNNAYAAVNPDDIPKSVPPPGPITDYFAERLSRFYDDLKDGGQARKAEREKELEQVCTWDNTFSPSVYCCC